MKTPIDQIDIRKGDKIRWEAENGDVAHEWRARRARESFDGDVSLGFGQHYIIEDRPVPAVVLPTVPTWGWLDSTANNAVLGLWQRRHLTGGPGAETIAPGFRALGYEITAFAEAVAVPKDALDELRTYFRSLPLGIMLNNPQMAIREFIHAVDEANEATR